MDRVAPPPRERETVLFLIRNHLELSAAMQGRDLFDPQTIREVAGRVETVERLKALTLLTYADIRGQPHGHDALARRTALATLSGGLQRADARA